MRCARACKFGPRPGRKHCVCVGDHCTIASPCIYSPLPTALPLPELGPAILRQTSSESRHLMDLAMREDRIFIQRARRHMLEMLPRPWGRVAHTVHVFFFFFVALRADAHRRHNGPVGRGGCMDKRLSVPSRLGPTHFGPPIYWPTFFWPTFTWPTCPDINQIPFFPWAQLGPDRFGPIHICNCKMWRHGASMWQLSTYVCWQSECLV